MSDQIELVVKVSAAEMKALSYVAADPVEWATNAVKERARHAMQEIFDIEVRRMVADPETVSIPADIESVVLASTLPSAADVLSDSVL